MKLGSSYHVLQLNQEGSFKDVKVRQAIACAIVRRKAWLSLLG
jgi:ABC-type transport system substrate-binding protein